MSIVNGSVLILRVLTPAHIFMSVIATLLYIMVLGGAGGGWPGVRIQFVLVLIA